MRVLKSNRNVIVVSHKVVHQPDDDLVLYLNNQKYQNVLHIMHSFANAKDRVSKYIWYKNGNIYKKEQTRDFKSFPEPVLYLKEFYYTTRWIIQSKLTWDLYIGLDGLCVLFGNRLRSLKKVKKTIFWAIDFVPEKRFKLGIKNTLYNKVNRSSYLETNEMWDLSPRMLEGRKRYLGIEKKDYRKHKVVPYGLWIERIKPVPYKDCHKNTILFMGNLSKYQGLQLIVSALPKLIKKYPKINLRVIGEGDYTDEIKRLARELDVYKHCEFLGRIKEPSEMEKKIVTSVIAVAPYMHELDNISRYADPGKIKTYLACGIPVLTTDIPWNAKEIQKRKCGFIITESEKDIISKVVLLMNGKRNEEFRKNALKYAKEFNFNEIFSHNI